jgi:RNA polymerase sigma-70 factor, ECF subfamily
MTDEASDDMVQYRDRLVRFVRGRLDRRLRGRIDASDVVQEACAEASKRLPEYQRDCSVPFYVWLRYLTAQRLALTHRQHLGTHLRDAGREEPGHEVLAEHLAASQTSPSNAAARAELRERLSAALAAMQPADREVLALRHFEQMSNQEAAAVLNLSLSAASHRYARALLRMKAIMTEMFGSSEGSVT